MSQEVYHIPALLPQVIEALNIRPGGTYVDATFGGGGHSRAIMDRLGPDGRLLAFDQDADALAGAIDDPRFTMVYGNFRYLRNFLRFYDASEVDGILADLGVSFHHFDEADRGFSFRADAPLDMRMNRHGRLTAREVVNDYPEERLAEILRLYGEVQGAGRVARALVKARATSAIDTTGSLMAVLEPLMNPRRVKKDLACVFQALRIEVNDELGALRQFLAAALRALRPGGRLAVLTYHSLEDRLVKNFLRAGNFEGKAETDLYGRSESPFKLLNSKPIVAEETEIRSNPRSRSAKLRVAVKLSPSDEKALD